MLKLLAIVFGYFQPKPCCAPEMPSEVEAYFPGIPDELAVELGKSIAAMNWWTDYIGSVRGGDGARLQATWESVA